MAKEIDLLKVASQAYLRNQSIPVSTSSESAAASDSVFASFVKKNLTSTIDTIKQAEEITVKSLQGKADTTQVITAMASADAALQAMVTVKEKIIEAYKTILSMQI
ncbi:MAG: flagellar hook-basal body complex protein FliE [Sphingobacteriia bacterium]|nr:flagellar hook-basal body complex protein FliE [Sphingobacteriia bacterium]